MISGNVLLLKDIKISMGLVITARKMHAQFHNLHSFKSVNYNFNSILLTNPSHIFSLDNSSEKLRETESKLVDGNTISQQARYTTIIA